MNSELNKWNKFHDINSGNQYPEIPVVKFVLRNFGSLERSKVKILDLGCGQGNHLVFLASEGFDTYGLDFSESAIEKSKQKLNNKGLSAKITLSYFEDLNFPENYFDGVIDYSSVQHCKEEEISIVINKVFKILKPGGYFFSSLIASDKKLNDKKYSVSYTTKSKINEKYLVFNEKKIDYMKYTEFGQNAWIKFWLVECRKNLLPQK